MKKFLVLLSVCFPLLFQSGLAQDTLWSVKAFDGGITSAKFSITGDTIIHTDGGYIVKRDLNGRLLDTFWVGEQHGMVLTPDYRFAITYNTPFLYQWDLTTKKLISRYEMRKDSTFSDFSNYFGNIDISPDGKYIGEISSVYPPSSNMRLIPKFFIWEAQTGKILLTDTAGCRAIQFSPNSDNFSITDECLSPVIWSVSKKGKIANFSGAIHQQHLINHISFSPDGKYLCTSDNSGYVNLWDIASKSILKIRPFGAIVFRFSNDSRYIIFGSAGIGIYDILRDTIIYQMDLSNKGFSYDTDIDESKDSRYILEGQQVNLLLYKNSILSIDGDNSKKINPILKPNPTSGKITIQLTQVDYTPFSIKIFNPEGMTMKFYNNVNSENNAIILDVSDLSIGIFFLVVENQNFSQTYKLVKE